WASSSAGPSRPADDPTGTKAGSSSPSISFLRGGFFLSPPATPGNSPRRARRGRRTIQLVQGRAARRLLSHPGGDVLPDPGRDLADTRAPALTERARTTSVASLVPPRAGPGARDR